MVYEIDKDKDGMPTCGFAAESARAGNKVEVIYRDFITPLNRPLFYETLENLGGSYLPDDMSPGCIETMIGVIRRDGSSTVYINEDIEITMKMRAANSIKKGQGVRKPDIADIKELSTNIVIPDDCGFFFIFHVGWMRCCYYDFSASIPDIFLEKNKLPESIRVRGYHIPEILGRCYRSVFFRERLYHTDYEWNLMFKNGWFPFFGLSEDHLKKLKNFWQQGWETDDIVSDIAKDLKRRLPKLLESWEEYEGIAEYHSEDLKDAVEDFMRNDHRRCGRNLYLKIEGIMRSDYMISKYRETILQEEEIESPNTDKLRKFVTTIDDVSGLLLPDKFKEYLKDFYFSQTDIKDKNAKPARHSTAHGYAGNWTEETSVVAFLIVEQIMRYIMERQWELESSLSTCE